MLRRLLALLLFGALTLAFFVGPVPAAAQSPAEIKIDKEACALMIRHGRDALERGRHEDAKYYFQRAVQADPFNAMAWNWYDLAVFYAAADQMKKEGRYMVRPSEPREQPDAPSGRPAEEAVSRPEPRPATPPAPPRRPSGFVIKDDEGC